MYHNPALLHESIEGLRISPVGTYVDLTFGGGGHSAAILERLTKGRLLVFDQDARALENPPHDPRIVRVHANFCFLMQFLRFHKAHPVDGILADLGVSSHQIDTPERGFTTRADAPLDMRMDISGGITAVQWLATISEEELADTLYYYGDIRNARQVAKAMVTYRSTSPFQTTGQLKAAVQRFMTPGKEHQFIARVFQALRIAVNREMEALKEMLRQCVVALKPGGRLVVISYHSVEDRLVKHFLRSGNFEDKPDTDFFGHATLPFRPVVAGAIKPTAQEIQQNPRARSARLRIGERAI
jgi:16S rRNA (cytosine1402-N4)-methyltransferase